MELKECITCGSHSFTDNKCDFCGNQYKIEPTWDEILEKQEKGMIFGNDETSDYEPLTSPKIDEDEYYQTETGKKIIKVMFIFLFSIIWFAVCVFIPPLFIIAICGLIILTVIKKLKK